MWRTPHVIAGNMVHKRICQIIPAFHSHNSTKAACRYNSKALTAERERTASQSQDSRFEACAGGGSANELDNPGIRHEHSGEGFHRHSASESSLPNKHTRIATRHCSQHTSIIRPSFNQRATDFIFTQRTFFRGELTRMSVHVRHTCHG